MASPDASNKFTEIKDEAVVAKLFGAAARAKIPVNLMLKVPEFKYETRFEGYFQRARRIEVLPPEGVRHEAGTEVIASFQIEAGYYFFKTSVIDSPHKTNVSLGVPRSLFRLQRRSTLRIDFSRTEAPRVSLWDPAIPYERTETPEAYVFLSFRVMNVSAGGMAIATLPEQKGKFEVGMKLHDIRFKIRGVEITTHGIVSNILDAKNDRSQPIARIGISYVGMKAEFEKLIARFVFDESRKIFTLLGGDSQPG